MTSKGVPLAILACFALLYGSLEDTIYDVDQVGYVEGARSILAGRGYRVPKAYSVEELRRAAADGFRTPFAEPGLKKEVRPIMYGYLLAGSMALFGTNLRVGNGLAVLFGLACLAMIYVLSRHVAGVAAASLMTVLTGVSYFFWRSSISIMTEAPSMAFALGGATCFLAAFRRQRPALFLPAGLCYGLATAIRPQQVVLVAASLVACGLSPRGLARGLDRRSLPALAGGAGLLLASLLPQYLYARADTLLYTRVALFAPQYFWQADASLRRPAWQILAYLKSFLLGGQLVFPLAALFVAVGVYLALARPSLELRFFLAWLAATFLLLAVERYFSLRYLAPAVVPAYLLGAAGYDGLRRKLAAAWGDARSTRVLSTVGGGVAGLALLTSTFAVLATVRVHQIRAAPFKQLKQSSTPDDLVLGIGTLGRFHHAGPFFEIGESPDVLEAVVEGARGAGKRVFLVYPMQRSVYAEIPFGSRGKSTGIGETVRRLGGTVVWSETARPPLRRWLPSTVGEDLSEGWALSRF